MPRLDPIEQPDAPREASRFYEADVERYGTVLNNTKLYAHNVPVLRAIKELSAAFAQATAVPIDQKALIRVRVAMLNGCPF
ncbi:MAG: hypothetical protein QOD55_1808 [Solirubrobacteraceae bacterium]|jgi:alkylhydroperoxidase family enzyme|nr:hypothetical protein [Solirubrobacteraceae bacterium]